MVPTHPLGTLKDLTSGTLKSLRSPGKAAGSTAGHVRDVVVVGTRVADGAVRFTGRAAATALSRLAASHPKHSDVVVAVDPDTTAAAEVQAQPASEPEPVNVVEELGLDPAPVPEPTPQPDESPEPVTSIDAEAEPAEVDVTPADIADQVSPKPDAPRPADA